MLPNEIQAVLAKILFLVFFIAILCMARFQDINGLSLNLEPSPLVRVLFNIWLHPEKNSK